MPFWSEHEINLRAVSLSWHGFRIWWSNTAADKMSTHCLELDITGYSLISWLSCFTILQIHYICNFHFQSNQVIDMSEGNSQVLVLQVKRFEGLQCWCAGLSDRWLNFDCIILAEVGAHLCQVQSFPLPWWKSSWVKWACLLLINLVSCIQEQDSSWWLTTCLLLPPKHTNQFPHTYI